MKKIMEYLRHAASRLVEEYPPGSKVRVIKDGREVAVVGYRLMYHNNSEDMYLLLDVPSNMFFSPSEVRRIENPELTKTAKLIGVESHLDDKGSDVVSTLLLFHCSEEPSHFQFLGESPYTVKSFCVGDEYQLLFADNGDDEHKLVDIVLADAEGVEANE